MSGQSAARASLKVVCSRGHDAARPLRIFDTGRVGAQQRGGQLGNAYRRPATSTAANHRCPKCQLAVPVPDGELERILARLADSSIPHLTIELDCLPQLLDR